MGNKRSKNMGASRRRRNQESMAQLNEEILDSIDPDGAIPDPEMAGHKSRNRMSQVLSYTSRVDHLATNWISFLRFSSVVLFLVIFYAFFTKSKMSYWCMVAHTLAALTACCTGCMVSGIRPFTAKLAAIVLVSLQATIHIEVFGTKPEGDWVFVVTMHFFMAWWGQTFSTRLSNSSQKLQDDMEKMVDQKSK